MDEPVNGRGLTCMANRLETWTPLDIPTTEEEVQALQDRIRLAMMQCCIESVYYIQSSLAEDATSLTLISTYKPCNTNEHLETVFSDPETGQWTTVVQSVVTGDIDIDATAESIITVLTLDCNRECSPCQPKKCGAGCGGSCCEKRCSDKGCCPQGFYIPRDKLTERSDSCCYAPEGCRTTCTYPETDYMSPRLKIPCGPYVGDKCKKSKCDKVYRLQCLPFKPPFKFAMKKCKIAIFVATQNMMYVDENIARYFKCTNGGNYYYVYLCDVSQYLNLSEVDDVFRYLRVKDLNMEYTIRNGNDSTFVMKLRGDTTTNLSIFANSSLRNNVRGVVVTKETGFLSDLLDSY